MSNVTINEARLAELLEKERFFDTWIEEEGLGFLIELARRKGIDPPSIINVADLSADIAQSLHEGEPISTAFIVGDIDKIERLLPQSELRLVRTGHIREMSPIIRTLAELVNGLVLAYAVDKMGIVRDIRKVDVELPMEGNHLLGTYFRRYCAISALSEGVVFFVPEKGRRVKVFADGQIIGRYGDGDWKPESMPELDRTVERLVAQRGYDRRVVERVLRCAFEMSEHNLGGVFMLGDADDILNRSEKPRLSGYAAILTANLDNLTDEELINFAKQDGATIVDSRGEFCGATVLLRPQAHTPAEVDPKAGARHTSAAKMSAECDCLAVVISHDGPISLYDAGRRVMRF
jgi:DNA integrity scanning protein DisA with diadenylate cyclase activity